MIRALRTPRSLALFVVLLLALASAGLVSAHAKLKSSIPAADATVDNAPAKVVLVFTEELLAEGNTVKVTDAAGAQVDQGDTTLDKSDAQRTTLVVSLKAGLGSGAYTVSWKNASGDGHSEEGSFKFSVGPSAAPAAPAAPANLPTTGGETLPLVALLTVGALLVGTGLLIRRQFARR